MAFFLNKWYYDQVMQLCLVNCMKVLEKMLWR